MRLGYYHLQLAWDPREWREAGQGRVIKEILIAGKVFNQRKGGKERRREGEKEGGKEGEKEGGSCLLVYQQIEQYVEG